MVVAVAMFEDHLISQKDHFLELVAIKLVVEPIEEH